jgi:hypothetical protein
MALAKKSRGGGATRGGRKAAPKSAPVEESDEEEVFDLGGQNESDEDDEDGDAEMLSDDSGEDDDDEEEEYHRTDLDQLVENLPSDIRQKVLRGHAADEEDDSDEEDSDHETAGWGKKSNYYSGDTADLEIGQDSGDAEDEELAAEVRLPISVLRPASPATGVKKRTIVTKGRKRLSRQLK